MYDGNVGDGSERRKYPRVPLTADAPVIHLRIELLVGDLVAEAQVINIAEEGMFLATKGPIERSVAVEVELVSDGTSCIAHGTVVWKTDAGIGLRLTKPSDEYREFVQRLAAVDLDERWEMLKKVSLAQVRAQ